MQLGFRGGKPVRTVLFPWMTVMFSLWPMEMTLSRQRSKAGGCRAYLDDGDVLLVAHGDDLIEGEDQVKGAQAHRLLIDRVHVLRG